MKVKKNMILLLAVLTIITSFGEYALAAYHSKGYKTNRQVTGYYSIGSDKPSSEVPYEVGYVAVHPQVWGVHANPIYPYGAMIHIDPEASGTLGEPIFTPLGEIDAFQVQDLGEVYNNNNRGYGWFDVYCGRPEDYGMTESQLKTWINRNIGTTYRNYTVSW